jgi:hypothetical protein
MIREWKAGNADALAQLMNEDESDPRCSGAADPPQHQLGRWIKARLDKPGTVLLAVGAGHLAGKGSVQEQLKKLGITVAACNTRATLF